MRNQSHRSKSGPGQEDLEIVAEGVVEPQKPAPSTVDVELCAEALALELRHPDPLLGNLTTPLQDHLDLRDLRGASVVTSSSSDCELIANCTTCTNQHPIHTPSAPNQHQSTPNLHPASTQPAPNRHQSAPNQHGLSRAERRTRCCGAAARVKMARSDEGYQRDQDVNVTSTCFSPGDPGTSTNLVGLIWT